MYVMDFKSKGISWVGNVYQKFETMCYEVDNIMSQDTVKYMEDQVNTMGENVKKFYSDVVQDIIPPFRTAVKHETQAVALKTNYDNVGNVKSMVGVGEDNGNTALLNQSPIESSNLNVVKSNQGNVVSGNHPVNQLITMTSEKEESHSGSEKVDDCSKKESLHVNDGENAIQVSPATEVFESINQAGEKSFESPVSNELNNHNPENACGFLAEDQTPASVHGEEFLPSLKVGTVCDNSADDSNCVSDASTNLEKVAICDNSANDSNCAPDVTSNLEVGSICDDSPDGSECVPDVSSNLVTGTVCDNSADESAFVSDSSSAFSLSEIDVLAVCSDKQLVEMEVASSSNSMFTEPLTLSGISFDNIRAKLASSFKSVNVAGYDSSDGSDVLLSSASVPTIFCKNRLLEKRLATSNSVVPLELLGSYGDFSNIDDDDLSDAGMETIDLSDKVKLDESCVIVDDSMLHQASLRTRKLRSYKKKIQDVFTSKRRLTKEYELLAVLHGDLDTVSRQDTVQNQLSSSITKNLDSGMQHDAEWELL